MPNNDARTALARAKVNLTLRVGPPLIDGRHPLDSLVAFTSTLGDGVSFEPAPNLSLEITGPFSKGLSPQEDNLVLRAAQLLQTMTGVIHGARILLEKRLPVASGIGGGSADAAATLIGLNGLWGCGLSRDQLAASGASLGADVPACVLSQSGHMTGTGETYRPLPPLPRMGIVLVNTLHACPTGLVYRRYDELGSIAPIHQRDMPSMTSAAALLDYLRATPNDLEAAARSIVPEIGDALGAIAASPQVRLARMSGSGATCFGLYDTVADAKAGAQAIKKSLASRPIWVEADELHV